MMSFKLCIQFVQLQQTGQLIHIYSGKGSSGYNTSEMSALIDGVVSECKEMGIETLPPEELERMMDAYDRKMERSDR